MKIQFAIAICASLLLTAYLGGPEQFGQKIKAKGAKAPEAILSELKAAKRDSVWIKVSGPVRAVCQMKGCWMTMDVAGQAMRIKFKDYAFFVPKDCVGRTAVIEGWAFQKVTPEEERKHYAEDAGKSDDEVKKITGDERSLSFEAVGVLLMPAK
jgi:hypothetical protein